MYLFIHGFLKTWIQTFKHSYGYKFMCLYIYSVLHLHMFNGVLWLLCSFVFLQIACCLYFAVVHSCTRALLLSYHLKILHSYNLIFLHSYSLTFLQACILTVSQDCMLTFFLQLYTITFYLRSTCIIPAFFLHSHTPLTLSCHSPCIVITFSLHTAYVLLTFFLQYSYTLSCILPF